MLLNAFRPLCSIARACLIYHLYPCDFTVWCYNITFGFGSLRIDFWRKWRAHGGGGREWLKPTPSQLCESRVPTTVVKPAHIFQTSDQSAWQQSSLFIGLLLFQQQQQQQKKGKKVSGKIKNVKKLAGWENRSWYFRTGVCGYCCAWCCLCYLYSFSWCCSKVSFGTDLTWNLHIRKPETRPTFTGLDFLSAPRFH